MNKYKGLENALEGALDKVADTDDHNILVEAYNELADEGNWESKNWKLVLFKGGLRIKSKNDDREITLTN